LPADLVAAYVAGALDPVTAWSVEAHLPGCVRCRGVLEGRVDAGRLARNRDVLLTRVALRRPGAVERALARAGLPPHVWRLLAVTPSLRAPWLAGVALVLATTIGVSWLAEGRPLAAAGTPAAGWPAGWPDAWLGGTLLPFLLLVPLLPLAGVAVAFDARFDPAAGVLAAAPVSGARLFFTRAVAVIGAALFPTVVAALALPVSAWLALLVVLPALAVSTAGLALSLVMPPLRAVLCAGGGWAGLVIGCGYAANAPQLAYGPAGQLACAVVLAAAAGTLCSRQHRLDLTPAGPMSARLRQRDP
jgi:hypothetical protein